MEDERDRDDSSVLGKVGYATLASSEPCCQVRLQKPDYQKEEPLSQSSMC
jgi:hypothetical protein